MTDLRSEIQQSKPFSSLEQEAQLNIVRTGALLQDAFDQQLRSLNEMLTLVRRPA